MPAHLRQVLRQRRLAEPGHRLELAPPHCTNARAAAAPGRQAGSRELPPTTVSTTRTPAGATTQRATRADGSAIPVVPRGTSVRATKRARVQASTAHHGTPRASATP